jgi:hypothetical protein
MRLSKVFDLIVHRYIICVTCKFRGSGLPTHRRMLEKQKKCPKGKVSLHLNRKLFRRLPLDFHGKITLIDSPSTSVLCYGSIHSIPDYVHKNWSIKWSVHYMDLNFWTFEFVRWNLLLWKLSDKFDSNSFK